MRLIGCGLICCLAAATYALFLQPGIQPAAGLPPIRDVGGSPAELFSRPDFVGIVIITKLPEGKQDSFRADAPPTVQAKPVAVFKGDSLAILEIVWQTHNTEESVRKPSTVPIALPAVNEEYMV